MDNGQVDEGGIGLVPSGNITGRAEFILFSVESGVGL